MGSYIWGGGNVAAEIAAAVDAAMRDISSDSVFADTQRHFEVTVEAPDTVNIGDTLS